jgi:hypothetical protein
MWGYKLTKNYFKPFYQEKAMWLPWRKISSWHCTACGRCCYEYKVRLNFYEYLRLRNTGFVEEKTGRYFIKKIGKKCPFQIGKLCSIQAIKPLACKLYPFTIRERSSLQKDSALYEYRGEEFYVYVNTFCQGVKVGKAGKNLERFVKEAVQLYIGEKRVVELITARLI